MKKTSKIGLCTLVAGLATVTAGKPHISTKTDIEYPNPVSYTKTGNKIKGEYVDIETDKPIQVIVDEITPNKPTSKVVTTQKNFTFYGKDIFSVSNVRTAYGMNFENPVLPGKSGSNGSIIDETGKVWKMVSIGHDAFAYKSE